MSFKLNSFSEDTYWKTKLHDNKKNIDREKPFTVVTIIGIRCTNIKFTSLDI